jgi:signal transduction histidine kinase
MSDDQAAKAPGWLRQLVAFARSAEPRTRLSRRAATADILIAAAFLAASLIGRFYGLGPAGLVAAVLMFALLAVRRRWPLTAFLLLLLVAFATKGRPSDVMFLALIFAGYSAAMHSRFRGAALLTLAPAGLLVAVVFWSEPDVFAKACILYRGVPIACSPSPAPAGLVGLQDIGGPIAARLGGLLVLMSLVSIAVVGAVMYAGDRIRRMQNEHAAETQRAIEAERARIASELHDVVTHNVSVMIVQAGAARQVLSESPGMARNALLAVEASGRAAMAELRHLLGLLSPAAQGPDGSLAEQDLRPQPGLQQLQPLIDRVAAAGLPVRLDVSDRRYDLPPGLDLAAFRVVQEALTNVLKHAGAVPTTVRIDYGESAMVVDVANEGRTDLATGPGIPAGNGRGLIGLRERISLYGGELDYRPRPGGGWRITARFPVDCAIAGLAPEPAAEQSQAGFAPLAADAR